MEGRTGRDALLALGHANHELREVVERTNFDARSELLADEIAAARPDLMGLQEVALGGMGRFGWTRDAWMPSTSTLTSWRFCAGH